MFPSSVYFPSSLPEKSIDESPLYMVYMAAPPTEWKELISLSWKCKTWGYRECVSPMILRSYYGLPVICIQRNGHEDFQRNNTITLFPSFSLAYVFFKCLWHLPLTSERPVALMATDAIIWKNCLPIFINTTHKYMSLHLLIQLWHEISIWNYWYIILWSFFCFQIFIYVDFMLNKTEKQSLHSTITIFNKYSKEKPRRNSSNKRYVDD